jgi:hypothetical protein
MLSHGGDGIASVASDEPELIAAKAMSSFEPPKSSDAKQ